VEVVVAYAGRVGQVFNVFVDVGDEIAVVII
jgi:hypothetical protein